MVAAPARAWGASIVKMASDRQRTERRAPLASDRRWLARDIIQVIEPINPSLSCGEVAQMFAARPTTLSFAVANGDRSPVGLVDRIGFMSQLAQRFGRALYENKPVALLMDANPVIVEAEDELQFISIRIALHKPAALQTGFIITEGARYLGLGSGLDLVSGVAGQLEETLTELKDAQAAIVQAEKFAALGQLVAGVAHEINTPVGIGVSAASHLSEKANKFRTQLTSGAIKKSDLTGFVEAVAEGASIISANLERAAELVQSFKQVAVDQTRGDKRKVDLRDHLDDLIASLGPSLKKGGHRLVLDCPPGISFESFPGPFAQVVSNLTLNAVTHAFDEREGGVIMVNVVDLGEMVEIRIIDNGKGIPDTVLPQIFEPFFTTKRGQGGTGLGLHIVFNIVTQTLGGTISCESTLGQGTEFVLMLPKVAKDAGQESAGARAKP